MSSSFKFFRNDNDYIHFYGSYFLTFVQFVFLDVIDIWVFNPILNAIILTNIEGLIWELLEDRVFVHHSNDEYWSTKPNWMRRHFSGDDWDWGDILRNFLGSTLIGYLVLIYLKIFDKEKI